MIKPTFALPSTVMCVVVWYRDGKKNEQLIDTPKTSSGLCDLMLMRYHVGFSEIRAVKAVNVADLLIQRV